MPEYLTPGVYVQEESSGIKPIEGVGTSTACFVGVAPRGRPYHPTYVTSWTEYERLFGGLDRSTHLPLAVYHFFLNGGKKAYIVRLLDPAAASASGQVALASSGGDANGELTIRAAGAGQWANDMRVEFRLSPAGAAPGWAGGDAGDSGPVLFDIVVMSVIDGEAYEIEIIPRVGVKEDGERFYASIINRDSRFIKVELPEGQDDFPENLFRVDAASRKLIVQLAGGTDGDAALALTKASLDRAFESMDVFDDVNMLVLPGVTDPVLQEGGISYASRRRDMIFIADGSGDARNRQPREIQLEGVKNQLKALAKSSHAALYFPWIEIADPYSKISGATRFAPPSGAIAGLYARTDNRRGVWKAPAGTEASILGAVGVAVSVTDNDQETLNPVGINCIRQFPDSGIVCWGSRTLATRQDPEYRYVPVRRFAMFLAKSLYRGTQWVVFEPNDEPLWSAIRFNLNAFMLRQFRSGALQGGKPEEAYFVKCDAENNPQATIDAGQVHITVGFSPLKPAEFVIIHLTQMRKE